MNVEIIDQLYRIIDSVTGRNKDNPMPGNISMEELRLRYELSEVDLYEP